MKFNNRITELLGVETPILQAPMGWIARSPLASAVSNAGALGIIETSSGELDAIRGEIIKMRELTDKPFGVDTLLPASVQRESYKQKDGPSPQERLPEMMAFAREFMEKATARPDFVGWHMCGMIDTSKQMRGKEKHQHQGLMTTHGEFYPEMEAAVRDVSSRLYDIASGQ